MPATVLVWVAEGTWHGCVDAARALVPQDARIVLLHVIPEEVAGAAHGAYAGLLGRGHAGRDPGRHVSESAAESAAALLAAAADRLGRPCSRLQRSGRPGQEVVAAATGMDLLVLARDGDVSRLGPRSLGPVSRFVVDHAPAPVLLVWPTTPPGTDTIPHPPPGPHPGPHPQPRGHPPL